MDFVVPHQSFRWMRSSLDPSQASARWSTPEPRGLGGDGRIRALGRMNTAASRRTRVRLGAVHHLEKSRLLGDSLREVALLRRHGPLLSGPQKETALRGGEFPVASFPMSALIAMPGDRTFEYCLPTGACWGGAPLSRRRAQRHRTDPRFSRRCQ